MAQISFQFGNEQFSDESGGGHKGLRRGVLIARRGSRPAAADFV